MVNLSGQVAIVTGGGRGIGRQVAASLAQAGARVAVVARSEDELDETVQALGATVMAAPADMTDEHAIHRVVAEVGERLGPVSLLVNNAAVFTPGEPPLWEADLGSWWRTIETNVRGPLVCTKAVLPTMIARGAGRIVTLGSDSGVLRGPLTPYSFGKSALVRFTESLAVSLTELGSAVRTFAISPGTVRTSMTEWFVSRYPDQTWTPAERTGELVVALASGRFDVLDGCYLSVFDDLELILSRAEEVERQGLYVQRMRRFDADGQVVDVANQAG